MLNAYLSLCLAVNGSFVLCSARMKAAHTGFLVCLECQGCCMFACLSELYLDCVCSILVGYDTANQYRHRCRTARGSQTPPERGKKNTRKNMTKSNVSPSSAPHRSTTTPSNETTLSKQHPRRYRILHLCSVDRKQSFVLQPPELEKICGFHCERLCHWQ